MVVGMRSEEVDEILSRCAKAQESGTHYPGMSYEEGVEDAIIWLLGAENTGRDEPDGWPFEEE